MRFKIIEGSLSAHCCFGSTVVDTLKPTMFGDESYVWNGVPQYESVCECFERADAELICAALNNVHSEGR